MAPLGPNTLTKLEILYLLVVGFSVPRSGSLFLLACIYGTYRSFFWIFYLFLIYSTQLNYSYIYSMYI